MRLELKTTMISTSTCRLLQPSSSWKTATSADYWAQEDTPRVFGH